MFLDWIYSSPSCSIPSHDNDVIICFLNSSFDLSLSVSSILKKYFPLFFLAKSQLNKAVLTPPMWRGPVGEGANLQLKEISIN